MKDPRNCSTCDTPLPLDGLQGLCPVCLLTQGIDSNSSADDELVVVRDSGREVSPEAPRSRLTGRPHAESGAMDPEGQRPGPPAKPKHPVNVGPYKVQEVLGEGGMGVVYLALQEKPVRRRVALKLIKLGMDTTEVVARFEAERQALAMMDHPNVARVYDAGATDNGRPYFVMEHVRGVPLGEYCDRHKLTVRQRLELFTQACHGVEHAHRRGIIHRDLKSSNVLVSTSDHEPVAKIIDFGVAKATNQRLAEKTIYTEIGHVVGTPAYMSPEQAELTMEDVDHRTDVYSLGVMLYELLVGEPPLDPELLAKAAFDEILRRIREEDPPTPSTRWTRLNVERMTQLAARRSSSPGELVGILRGDLDSITMKAVEKERQRRYTSASDLAADVDRYLRGDPVLAGPPGLVYRLRKFARKQRTAVAATVAVFAALALGLVASLFFAFQAARSADDSARNEGRARQAEQSARDAQGEAENRLRDSLLAQARALRWSGKSGMRFEALQALEKAASLRPALDLRNEAIACMALVDVRVERGWPGSMKNLAFDADCSRYVVGDGQGNVGVHSVENHAELVRLEGSGVGSIGAKFSPDGKLLAVKYRRGRNNNIRIWDLSRGESLLDLPNTHDGFTLDFSSDSRRVAVGQPDGSIRLYDLVTMSQLTALSSGHEPFCLCFDPGAERIAVSSHRSLDVEIWDLETSKVTRRLRHPKVVDEIVWYPQGARLATACRDSNVHVWNVGTGEVEQVLNGHQAEVVHVAFSHRSGLLVSSSWDGTTRIWRPSTGSILLTAPARCMEFSRDGRWLGFQGSPYSGPNPNEPSFELWKVSTGRECRFLPVEISDRASKEPGVVQISPHGRFLAMACGKFGVRLWDLAAGEEIVRLPIGFTGSVVFHPGGRELITSSNRAVYSWPMEAGDTDRDWRIGPPRKLSAPGGDVSLIADGRVLAIAPNGGDRAVIVNPEAPGTPVVLGKHSRMNKVDISPDGKWAATSTWQGQGVKVWDARSGKLVEEFPGYTAYGTWSPDGKWLVISTGKAHVFHERGSWQIHHRIPRKGAGNHPGRVAFSPDGRLAAVTISRSSLQLVDSSTGAEIAKLIAPHVGFINYLCFSPDGAMLAVSSKHVVQLWDLRRVRSGLARMDLDWALPPYPPESGTHRSERLRIQVDFGDLPLER